MASTWLTALAVVVSLLGVEAAGGGEDCFSSASVVGAVIGSVVVLLGLEAAAYMLWRLYWRSRRGQHLVLVTDPEKGGDYAFDNPCFKDATPVGKAGLESKDKIDQKNNKWTSWAGLGAIRNNLGGLQGEKRRALDDSCPTEPQVTQVSLRSHDFTGLGFNICGNMRDGIFVKDVLHRGPASESGLIFPGDRIHGIRISLRHMVFEDALTILSYASPYEVTLEVESGTTGASSRPSSLLRREREKEKEKEALAQVGLAPSDRIVHPFYRSQSIADLPQIGKSNPKRPHALDSPARSETPSDYPTLKLPSAVHTSTPQVRHEASTAVIAPSSSVVVVKPERASNVHKMGVRVLPDAQRQNAHNAYLERGIDVPDGYNPYAAGTASTVKAPSPTGGHVHGHDHGFHDVDLGERTSSPTSSSEDHHRMGMVAKEVKTKITKGIHSLLHSLDRTKKASKDEPGSQQPHKEEGREENQKSGGEFEVMTRQPSGRGIPTEIPEEVRLAAMAARSNRKSLGALPIEAERSEATTATALVEADNHRASSRTSSSSGEQKPKRKGLAPRPPSVPVSSSEETTPFVASPSSSPTPYPASAPAVANHNGEESLQSLPLQSDSDSEAEVMTGCGPRATIELTASHVTVHHSHGLDEETTRKAASLGDLSRIEDQLPSVAVLERAVSLDLDANLPSHGKKRKAPSAPTAGDIDATGEDISLDALDDSGFLCTSVARKEPRLDIGLGLGHVASHERSRLKKSSDWGTLEEALTAPTVAEVIPKGELRNSFFVGHKFGKEDSYFQADDQPFSFTGSSLEPLSIEVRADTSESDFPAQPPTSSSDRDKVLWSIPGSDGASRISVNPSSSPASSSSAAVNVISSSASTAVGVDGAYSQSTSGPPSLAKEATGTPPPEISMVDSGPSSLTLVSSTPMRPDHAALASALQSPIVSSSDLLRAGGQGFVSTTQLNSLDDPSASAFLTAVDSTLMQDALDNEEGDLPDLPASPMPVSSPLTSLTYVTEIQVTTPDSSAKVNGFSTPSPAPSSPCPPSSGPSPADEPMLPSPTPDPRPSSPCDQSIMETTEQTVTIPASPPSPPVVRVNGNSSPSSSSATSNTVSTSATTPKQTSKNVSVTAIQGSRIPVRATSHSPDDRMKPSTPAVPTSSSPLRPPVPARRSTDLSPRKANGVHVVNPQQPTNE